MKTNSRNIDPASFRDPSGFVYCQEGELYRQVNDIYRENFDNLIDSGLYDSLMRSGLIIPHQTTDLTPGTGGSLVIKPKKLPFVSYPYEYCFGQLQAAALSTLQIQKEAIAHGQTLKDASAYNIGFLDSKPVLIDTLSFESLDERKPWIAYRQFCQHFLAPLALMSHTDIRLSQLLRVFIDGIPLDLASSLLPWRTWFSFPLLTHIHLHAKSQSKHAGKSLASAKGHMNRRALLGLFDNLESCCKNLSWKLPATTWGDYYQDTNYSQTAADHKAEIISAFADLANPASAWDLGANDGRFSRILSKRGIFTVAFDLDPAAVQKNWQQVKRAGESNLLPLALDLTNPSAGVGWAGVERKSLSKRGPAEMIMALALVHHLAIGNNVPLGMIAEFLAEIGKWLIIEFVPKDDSQVQRLLASRTDIFSDYTEDNFRDRFAKYFEIVRHESVQDSKRSIYLMKRL